MTGHNNAALNALAERCEQASGPDRELDCRIWALLGWTEGGNDQRAWKLQLPLAPSEIVNGLPMAEAMERYPSDMSGIGRNWNVPRLTSSLDAAISLVPEGWEVALYWGSRDFPSEAQMETEAMRAICGSTFEPLSSRAATPALALCAASLRAQASSGDHP